MLCIFPDGMKSPKMFVAEVVFIKFRCQRHKVFVEFIRYNTSLKYSFIVDNKLWFNTIFQNSTNLVGFLKLQKT